MKKRRNMLGIALICVIGLFILGITYKPEKPGDSLTDIYEINTYIGDYLANYVPSDNERLNELVETIVTSVPRKEEDVLVVGINNCTFWKKNLFRKEILNSKHVVFMECEYGVND